jgi:hypothetical protein
MHRADVAERSRKRFGLPGSLNVTRQFADYWLAGADGASPDYDAAKTQRNEKPRQSNQRDTLERQRRLHFTAGVKDQDRIKEQRSGIGDMDPVAASRMLTSGNEFVLNGIRRRTCNFKERSPVGVAGKNGEAESVRRGHNARGANLEIPAKRGGRTRSALEHYPPLWGKEPSAFGLIRAKRFSSGGGVGAAACAVPNKLANPAAAIPATLTCLRAISFPPSGGFGPRPDVLTSGSRAIGKRGCAKTMGDGNGSAGPA